MWSPKRIEKNSVSKANIQRYITSCTKKLEVKINDQSFEIQAINNSVKKNLVKLDEVIMLQQ